MKAALYLFCFLLLIACGSENPLPEPDPGPDPKPEEIIDWEGFANDFQNTLTSVYSGRNGTYITRPNQPNFNYWFNAHVLDVLVDGYERTKSEEYLVKMKSLLRGMGTMSSQGYWRVYVDDLAWLGISSMNAWSATKDDEYKQVATNILNEIKKAHTPVLGGRLQWRFDEPNGKNACSTAPGAILALRLYAADKNEENLIFAKELYEWETETLLNPANDLIWDNIHFDEKGIPTVQTWMFTYNVGTYVGMARDLFQNTGDEKYLESAVRSARASISHTEMVANGMFKETGDHDGGLFKGILVRYLAELVFTDDVADPQKNQLINFLTNNARILLEKGTSPAPMILASSDWSARPQQPADISTQLSAMMLVEAVAKFEQSGLLKLK